MPYRRKKVHVRYLSSADERLYIYVCLNVYMYVLYGIVITCVLSCDPKKFDDD